MHDLAKLDVYGEALSLAVRMYRFADSLPTDERFGLSRQIRRAAVSVPSNIAEGAGRGDRRDFARFIRIAIGSLYELSAQLEICRQMDLGDHDQRSQCSIGATSLQRRLNALERTLAAP